MLLYFQVIRIMDYKAQIIFMFLDCYMCKILLYFQVIGTVDYKVQIFFMFLDCYMGCKKLFAWYSSNMSLFNFAFHQAFKVQFISVHQFTFFP